jgi:predicted transcriptional regulator
MKKLSPAEEQLMQFLWQKEKAFLKDLLEAYPEPRPASTTIATLLKRIADKGFIDYTVYGNSREYFPLVKKEAYFAKNVKGLIKSGFNDSALQFASFFTQAANLNAEQLKELRKFIDQEIQKKKK